MNELKSKSENDQGGQGHWIRIPFAIVVVLGLSFALASLIFKDHCQSTPGSEWPSPDARWKAAELIRQCRSQPPATDIVLFEKTESGWSERESILLMAGKTSPKVTWQSGVSLTISYAESKVLAKRSRWEQFQIGFEVHP